MLSRSGWLWLNFVIIPASCNHFLENIIHREKRFREFKKFGGSSMITEEDRFFL